MPGTHPAKVSRGVLAVNVLWALGGCDERVLPTPAHEFTPADLEGPFGAGRWREARRLHTVPNLRDAHPGRRYGEAAPPPWEGAWPLDQLASEVTGATWSGDGSALL